MKYFIGVDPGNTGGMVILDRSSKLLQWTTWKDANFQSAAQKPLNSRELLYFRAGLYSRLHSLDNRTEESTLIGIEVPFISSHGIPLHAAGNLCYQQGLLQSELARFGTIINVQVHSWKYRMLLSSHADKEAGYERATHLLSHVPWKKSHHGLTDALLIAEFIRLLWFQLDQDVTSIERHLALPSPK